MTTSNLLVTDTWVKATWSEFMTLAYDPAYEKGKAYYNRGKARIEMTPVGWNHAENNSIVSTLIILYCSLKSIPFKELTNCSLRKQGLKEAQPNIAFYLSSLNNIPNRSNSPVDLNQYSPPTLAVEIAATSLSDDLGEKRLLYESLNVQEYWVVDVNEAQVMVFAIADGGSKIINHSQVLPELTISLVEETLKRSRDEEHGAIIRWLLEQFS